MSANLSKTIIFVQFSQEFVNQIAFYLNIIELILILGAYPIVFSVFYIFEKCPLFHRNLKILVINMAVEFALLATSRWFVVTGKLFSDKNEFESQVSASNSYFTGPLVAAQMIRLVACSAFIVNSLVIAIERFCATIFFRRYEKRRNNKFLTFAIIFQWMIGALTIYLFIGERIPTTILIGGELCIVIASYIVSLAHFIPSKISIFLVVGNFCSFQ